MENWKVGTDINWETINIEYDWEIFLTWVDIFIYIVAFWIWVAYILISLTALA